MMNLFGSPAGRAISELKLPPRPSCNSSSSSSSDSVTFTVSSQHQQRPCDLLTQTQIYQPRSSHPDSVVSLSSSTSVAAAATAAPVSQMTNFDSSLQQQNEIKFNTADMDKSKKNLKFKPNVIAKKTKFWKFLEDDNKTTGVGGGGTSQMNSLEDLSTTSSGGKNR